jgi:hypothetical protein
VISLVASSAVFGGGFASLHASINFLYLHLFSKGSQVRKKVSQSKHIHHSLFLILAKYIRTSVNKMDI